MSPAGESAPGDLSVELVHRIQGGDSTAFEDLYRRYHDPLLFAIRARLGTHLRTALESEDVLQSVFKDALSDIQRFEARGGDSLAHWLHVCVLNKIRAKAEFHGAAKRSGAEPLTATVADGLAAPSLEPQYFDAERWGSLEPALARLADDAREVVILRSVEGLSNEDAARALGRTPAATSKLYTRALARLGVLLAAQKGSA
ncbi:MAG: sigma-70 family RNA polymerase sigma factor [Planctomycetes bacterium]|nr:sigma-70 family RNA polymerase sigma factor [Planctomycetota bacterium]